MNMMFEVGGVTYCGDGDNSSASSNVVIVETEITVDDKGKRYISDDALEKCKKVTTEQTVILCGPFNSSQIPLYYSGTGVGNIQCLVLSRSSQANTLSGAVTALAYQSYPSEQYFMIGYPTISLETGECYSEQPE